VLLNAGAALHRRSRPTVPDGIAAAAAAIDEGRPRPTLAAGRGVECRDAVSPGVIAQARPAAAIVARPPAREDAKAQRPERRALERGARTPRRRRLPSPRR
jgi:hypothetical protein